MAAHASQYICFVALYFIENIFGWDSANKDVTHVSFRVPVASKETVSSVLLQNRIRAREHHMRLFRTPDPVVLATERPCETKRQPGQ
jgi:hypothetical protein